MCGEKLVCVICKKDDDKVIVFVEKTLKKSHEVLEIRKHHGLKYNNIVLPVIPNHKDGYHTNCYKNFLALMKKYYEKIVTGSNVSTPIKDKLLSDNSHQQSAFETSISATTVELSTFTAEPSTSTLQRSTSTVEQATLVPQSSASILQSCTSTSETHVSVNDEDNVTDTSSTSVDIRCNIEKKFQLNQKLCIFCDKNSKKYQGQRQPLSELDKEGLIKSLEKYKTFIQETETFQKIQNLEMLYNHRICRKNYFNKLRELEKKPETNYHKNLQLHKEAFNEICSFIDESVINNKKFYSFTFICTIYLETISNIAAEKGEEYNNVFSRAHFENKLRKKYQDTLQILLVHNKKILGPTGYSINDNLFTVIEESDVLQKAALILRRTILDIKKTPLPEYITTSDLLKGECTTPQIVKDFYSTVLRGCNFKYKLTKECERKSSSLAEDLIFNASHGKIKTSKHITLAMTLKSITSSRKVVEIINKYGHCCSYHTIEELETEATFSSSSRSSSCPEGIITADGFCTGVAYDNFDRFIDTASGKNTLHDTVGIIYQNAPQVEDSEDDVFEEIPDNDKQEQSEIEGNSNDKTRKKKRRRKFEAIVPDLQPFPKKARLSETLLSSSDERRSFSVTSLQKVKILDILWMLSHALKIPNTPMWVGFNSKFVKDINTSRQKICYLTPINESPTAKNVVLETLKESQKIAEEVKQSEIEVTYDLAIAKVAMQIQSIEKPLFDNVFIHLGPFHIMLAYFKAIGKFISDCGLMDVAVESRIIASGSVDSFISGKHFNRCKRLHPLMALGLEILHFRFFLENEKITIPENFETELIAFNNQNVSYDALLNNSEVSEIISAYSAFKEACLSGTHGITPQFYMIYINLVNYYQMLSRSIRTGEFSLFKYILPKINNIFFVVNQPNYARWLLRYHENLIKLEETHPKLHENMGKGHFGIQRTDKSFSRQPIDLTLEQTINADAGRRLTGVIHFTNSISARQRWCKSHEIRSTIISHTYEITGLRKHTDVTADLESYNIRRDSKHLKSFVDAFSKFVNPFDAGIDKLQLFNISSGRAATQAVQDYLVNIEENGTKLCEQFISECTDSADRFEKSIRKVKIMNFSNEIVKKTVKSGNKEQEIKMQRDLFGRMLGLSLDYKVDMEKILCYPVTPFPMSMCRLDGSLYQTDKSAIVKCFEKQHNCTDAPKAFDVVIVDGFFLLHTMHDIPATFSGISKKIMSILTAFKAARVDIVFDQYFFPSVKDYERTRRNEQRTIDFNIIGPSQTRPTDFMKELKNIKFKQSFVKFLIEYWATDEMVPFIGKTFIRLNYDSCYSYIVKNNVVEMTIDEDMTCNNHEEADTKIVYHVCKLDAYAKTNVLLKTSDTDVLIIMLGNMDHLQSDELKIFMEYGTGNSKRYINVTKLHMELGSSLCTSLPGFHALTGCDYNPSFFKKGKITPYKILIKNKCYQKALTDLGVAHITGSRNEILPILEAFVCEIYGYKNISDINAARFEKFCATYKADTEDEPFKKTLKNCDPSTLPPCKAELQQHLLRTQYITSIWRNAYLRFPTSLIPDRNGWTLNEDTLDFHWFDGDCMPQLVFDAVVHENNKNNNVENVTAANLINGDDDAKTQYVHNTHRALQEKPFTDQCPLVRDSVAEIDTTTIYPSFDFQPSWLRTKEFWDRTFEDRYEKIKNDTRRPPLKVIVVPHSHNDPGWLKTFEQYFEWKTKNIINNIVQKLHQFPNMTFIWTEMSFLNAWWERSHPVKQKALKKLIRDGRLEITAGGWVMPDEACTHIYALVDQFIEGHQWVKTNLGISPKTGWSIDPFGHGPTVPYLLDQSGLEGTVIQRIHYAWKQWLAQRQIEEFYWITNWAEKKPSLIVHNQPFDIYSIKSTCGPHPSVCLGFDFRKIPGEYSEYTAKYEEITDQNLHSKSKTLIDEYDRIGSLTTHNVVLVPLGDDFRYEYAIEFDAQYTNYMKMFNYINNHKDIFNADVSFGTPLDYFNAMKERHKNIPTLKGDFFVYSDIFSEGKPAYWSGYYTTRPYLKILARQFEHHLRTAEIIFTLVSNYIKQSTTHQLISSEKRLEKFYEQLITARRNLALFQHHDAITGTSKSSVMFDYGTKLFTSIYHCIRLQEAALTTIMLPDTSLHSQSILQSQHEWETYGKQPKQLQVSVVDKRKVVLFNSLAEERTDVISVRSNTTSVRVYDTRKKEYVQYQITPVIEVREHGKYVISDTNFDILFVATLPPLTAVTFNLEDYTNTSQHCVIFCNNCSDKIMGAEKNENFAVKKMMPGDIQLENSVLKLLVDRNTGLLRQINRKDTRRRHVVEMQFGAYQSAQRHSGAYLFMPDYDAPEKKVLHQYGSGNSQQDENIIILSGPVSTEITTMYLPLLVHTVKIYNVKDIALSHAVHVVNVVDFENPPKNRETELFMRLQTNIQNGEVPEFYTDQNGFQFQKRIKVDKLGIEGNYYPITTMAWLQDEEVRLTLITDHAQGAASYEPGRLEVMLDRRTLYDDHRGIGEGVVDNKPTVFHNWILVEPTSSDRQKRDTSEHVSGVLNRRNFSPDQKTTIYELPTRTADHLSRTLNYPMNVYLVDSSEVGEVNVKAHQTFIQNFPPDVHLVTLRTITDEVLEQFPSTSCFMVLQRPGISCALGDGSKRTAARFTAKTLFNGLHISNISAVSLTGLKTHRTLSGLQDIEIAPLEIKTYKIKF